jgi:CRP-like cAMP-binding protein
MTMATSALLRKLSIFADLSSEEVALLEELTNDIRDAAAKRDIISDGERPERLHLICEGWAARYKMLPNGARQITAFLLPGDFCDLHATLLGKMDHSIVALTPCKVAWVSTSKLDQLTATHADLTRVFWWSTLLDGAILRAWLVNNGRREALERVAHQLCELHARMMMIGLVEDDRLDLPVTQEDLGDATGLTAVHVNRTLQRLRADGLIELSRRVLTVKDLPGLQRLAQFDGSYLHVARRLH